MHLACVFLFQIVTCRAGSNTSLPALSAFSLYAAFAMLFNLLLQVCLSSHACSSGPSALPQISASCCTLLTNHKMCMWPHIQRFVCIHLLCSTIKGIMLLRRTKLHQSSLYQHTPNGADYFLFRHHDHQQAPRGCAPLGRCALRQIKPSN